MSTGTQQTPIPQPTPGLYGLLVRAGTMQVADEETTGVVVEISRSDLQRASRVPLYRSVAVIEVQVLIAMEQEVARLRKQVGMQETFAAAPKEAAP